MRRRYTWNKAYRSEGEAHLEIAHALSLGDLTKDREPRVEKYENRAGRTSFKITVLPRQFPEVQS